MFNMNENFDCEIILASQSPRRKELLSLIFDKFSIVPAKREEIIDKSLTTHVETVVLMTRIDNAKLIIDSFAAEQISLV